MNEEHSSDAKIIVSEFRAFSFRIRAALEERIHSSMVHVAISSGLDNFPCILRQLSADDHGKVDDDMAVQILFREKDGVPCESDAEIIFQESSE